MISLLHMTMQLCCSGMPLRVSSLVAGCIHTFHVVFAGGMIASYHRVVRPDVFDSAVAASAPIYYIGGSLAGHTLNSTALRNGHEIVQTHVCRILGWRWLVPWAGWKCLRLLRTASDRPPWAALSGCSCSLTTIGLEQPWALCSSSMHLSCPCCCS